MDDEKLGATGKYPQGKPLNHTDKGELKASIGIENGFIIMRFGDEPVKWFAMNKEQALITGTFLITLSKKLP